MNEVPKIIYVVVYDYHHVSKTKTDYDEWLIYTSKLEMESSINGMKQYPNLYKNIKIKKYQEVKQ